MATESSQPVSEEMLDKALADSFPASDPPAWSLGREKEAPSAGNGAKFDLGISEKEREGTAKILNTLLADEYLLYTKTRNYHWNVVGPRFNDLHRFFQEQYEQLDGVIDRVAERARSLDKPAAGTLAEFLQLTRLAEQSASSPSTREMLVGLLYDHQSIVRNLRLDLASCPDAATNDFLTELMEKHEKMAWMLRALARDE